MRFLADVLALVEGSHRAPSLAGATPPLLSPEATAWFASPHDGLRAAIEPAQGAEAATRALARLAPSRATVLRLVTADRACWAEITRHSQGGDETCIVGLTYAPEGEISRLVWLRAPLVPAREAPGSGDVPDARPVLERYFADLMSSRFSEAASHFTVDTLYSHPPYAGGTQRVLFEGRDVLSRGFAEQRGPSPARQIITQFWQQGDRAFVEGVIEGIPGGGSFFSTAQITPAGAIARYVAFYSATRIPVAAEDVPEAAGPRHG